jgi:hypothetical protein
VPRSRLAEFVFGGLGIALGSKDVFLMRKKNANMLPIQSKSFLKKKTMITLMSFHCYKQLVRGPHETGYLLWDGYI